MNACLPTDDIMYHLIYSHHFSKQFLQGDFYPRWLQDMNVGFGSPTFFFYGPIPYFFTSIFSLLPDYSSSSCNDLGIASFFALAASGLTAYCWLKEIVPKNYATLTSIIYMGLPFYLAVDLYRRFAFAEYWSFVWMPLVLFFTIKIVKNSKINIIGLAISLALLIMTHLPTFIIFFPVVIGYAFFVSNRKQWKMTFIRLNLAIIIGVGLSAIYWLPAMTTQQSISMDAILTGMYDYKNNFLFTGPKVQYNEYKYYWNYLELLTIVSGGLAFTGWKISRKFSAATLRQEVDYWMVISLLSIFMMLPLSEFIWDTLLVIQKIQFPARFNTILTISITGILAPVISQLQVNYAFSNFFSKVNYKKKLSLCIYLFIIISTVTIIQIIPCQKIINFHGSENTILALAVILFLLIGISFIRQPINFYRYKFVLIGFVLIISLFLNGIFLGKSAFYLRWSNAQTSNILKISQAADEHRPQ